jgi:hypothetical protein
MKQKIIELLIERHQAQIAAYFNMQLTPEEKITKNAIIEELAYVISICKKVE